MNGERDGRRHSGLEKGWNEGKKACNAVCLVKV